MVIESSQQPVKRGRGRPRKVIPSETVSKAAATKHVDHSRHTSKKVDLEVESASWEDELAAFERRSNKSGVLTLLVLLLGIALIGYGMYLKLNQADSTDRVSNGNLTATVPTETGVDVTGDTTPVVTTPTTSANGIIADFFNYVNKGEFTALAALQDGSFKSLSSLKNYFNNTRLETFVKNTVNGIRIENIQPNTTDPALVRNPTARAYDFVMKYTLKSDQKEYTDMWRAYTIVKGTTTVINGFVYEGTDASQSPFFQFSKFGIK